MGRDGVTFRMTNPRGNGGFFSKIRDIRNSREGTQYRIMAHSMFATHQKVIHRFVNCRFPLFFPPVKYPYGILGPFHVEHWLCTPQGPPGFGNLQKPFEYSG